MAKNKTTETENSVDLYLKAIEDGRRRKDCKAIIELMANESGFPPKMCGPGIVGFGSYHYIYDSGHEGDAPLLGMASRADAITLYLGSSFDQREELLSEFGKHKTSKSCIYIKKLKDVDMAIFAKLVKKAFAHNQKHHAC